MKNASINKNMLVCQFTYDPAVVSWVRTLVGRRWNPDSKAWTADLLKTNIESCLSQGFSLSNDLCSWYQATQRPPEPVKPLDVPGLKEPLFPFQGEGVGFVEKHNGRVLLAHEMGLGKTIMSLAWLHYRKEIKKVLIVCPNSVKIAWNRELIKFIGDEGIVVDGNRHQREYLYKVFKESPSKKYLIVNYDVLSTDLSFIQNI